MDAQQTITVSQETCATNSEAIRFRARGIVNRVEVVAQTLTWYRGLDCADMRTAEAITKRVCRTDGSGRDVSYEIRRKVVEAIFRAMETA